MTRRVLASSVNVRSGGHTAPYPRVGVGPAGSGVGAGSLIWVSLRGAQIMVVEAAARAGVARCADLVNPDQECVTVTVQRDRLDVLRVARRVTLAPVLTPAAGPEGHPSRRQRAMKRLVVHPADHEHLFAVVLLHNGTDQAVVVTLQA